MDIINQLYDESNKKHEALASSLEQRASALHGQLLAEIGTLNHDIFHRGFASAADPMVQSSKQFVESNMIERERAGGPSIRRFKFHPSYWKYWHGEKTVLDHISRERHAQLEREKNAKRVISDKERQARARKDRAAFTNTNVNANSKFFDQHLLGDTSVPYILQKSLHQPVISEESLDPAFNMVYPHHRRTPVRNGKTISFGRAPKASGRDRVRSETSSCDIPPLPSAFDKDQGKGLGFSSAKRFPSLDNSAAAAAVPPQSQNAPLSSSMRLSTPSAAPSSSSSLGFHFPQAPRFVKEMPSATGAVGPGEYPLPRLLDPSKEQAEALRKVFEKYNTQRSHGLM